MSKCYSLTQHVRIVTTDWSYSLSLHQSTQVALEEREHTVCASDLEVEIPSCQEGAERVAKMTSVACSPHSWPHECGNNLHFS